MGELAQKQAALMLIMIHFADIQNWFNVYNLKQATPPGFSIKGQAHWLLPQPCLVAARLTE